MEQGSPSAATLPFAQRDSICAGAAYRRLRKSCRFALSSLGRNGMNVPQVRLTDLAHGGGCGCKLAPSVLQQLLANQPAAGLYAQLLVGTETGDDAAVWRIDDNTCVIATTDFFMPVVDDPRDFGRIAAANAL